MCRWIWQASTGKELVTYRGHTASTEQVRFAPGAHRLITTHGDGTVRLWACEACGPIEQVRALANTRATRPLTPDERDTFLP